MNVEYHMRVLNKDNDENILQRGFEVFLNYYIKLRKIKTFFAFKFTSK